MVTAEIRNKVHKGLICFVVLLNSVFPSLDCLMHRSANWLQPKVHNKPPIYR